MKRETVLGNGRVLEGIEFIEYCKRHGLCAKCGKRQTHKKVGFGWKARYEPIDLEEDENGSVIVYKGYCISPTCYSSIEHVTAILNGQVLDPSSSGYHNTITSPGSTSNRSTRSILCPPGLHQSNTMALPFTSHERQQSSSTTRTTASDNRHDRWNTSIWSTATSTSDNAGKDTATSTNTPKRSDIGIMSSFSSHTSDSSSYPNIQNDCNPIRSPISQQQQQQRHHCQLLRHHENDTDESKRRMESSSSHQIQSSVSELEALVVQGDYIRFLNELNDKGSDKVVALEGFKLLRFHFVEKQRQNDSVISGCENWTKTIHDRMTMIRRSDGKTPMDGETEPNRGPDTRISCSSTDKDVVLSGLLVFLTLSTLPGSYRKDMLRKGSAKLSLEYIDEFKGDKNICETVAALFLSLSMKEKDGLNVKYDGIRTLVDRLVRLVCNGEYGRDCTVRALYYMSHQKKRPGMTQNSLSHDLKVLFGSNMNMSALIGILKEPKVREQTAESTLSLLWRMSIPKDEDQIEGQVPVSHDTILSLARVMDLFDSIPIHESSYGILSNLSLRSEFPFESIGPCFQAMNRFLVGPNIMDEGLAISASHAICNMLASNLSRKVILSDGAILETIILLLGQHSSSEEIVENACLALAHAGRYDQTIKDSIVKCGGFNLVKDALNDFVIQKGEDQSFEVKDASLCAIAAISGCNSGVEAIRDDGFLETLQTLLAVESDLDFTHILEVIIENCEHALTRNVSVEHEQTIVESPEQFAIQLIRADTAKSVAVTFQGMIRAGEATIDGMLSSMGFPTIIEAMARFADSASVQKHGCALLAEIYFSARDIFSSDLGSPWSHECLNAALDTIHRTMVYHRNDTGIKANAHLVIINISSRLPDLNVDVSKVLSLLLDDILDGLRSHGSHQPSVISGTSALLAIIEMTTLTGTDLSRSAGMAVRHVSDTITRFPNDTRILATSLDIFLRLLNERLCLSLIGGPSVISCICNLVSNDNSDVAGRASAILACLVDINFASASHIMESSGAVHDFVSALSNHHTDLHLQINVCFVIASLINYGSDFAVNMQACAGDCLLSLVKAINLHKNCAELIIHICCIIKSLSQTFSTDIPSEMKEMVLAALTTVMDRHVEEPEVEFHVFDALSSMGRNTDDIKELLVKENTLRAIIAIMGVHIGSVEVQRSGCALLCVLSGYWPAKEAIGQEGIGVIINALLAHNQSPAVQREGLSALKSLATESRNKNHISSRNGEDAVLYSLWIHYRDPFVLSTGLSALNNIAVDGATRTVSEMREQIFMITIGAMSRFPDNELVQKNACFYLKSCSYLPSNLRMMADHSEQLIPLLIHASETFPEQCKGRAHSIIDKMTKF